jgi:hypothetical protein
MKTKKVATFLPLLAGIGFGVVSLAVPFLLANHYIFVEGVRYSADNYLFFLWGKYYTVAGSNLIQSRTVMYDFGDFPIYAMIAVAIGMIFAAISMFSGKGLILNVKGRVLKFKVDINPIWLQATSVALVLMSYIYMNTATTALIRTLVTNNYITESGPSMQFMLGSILALSITTIMTAAKYMKDNNKDKNAMTD